MARKATTETQVEMTPEFQRWLKNNNVRLKRSDVRKNPEMLSAYHKEWQKSLRKSTGRRSLFSSFSLPNIDLLGLTANLSKANDIMKTIQSLRDLIK